MNPLIDFSAENEISYLVETKVLCEQKIKLRTVFFIFFLCSLKFFYSCLQANRGL